jgi:hypothetical protein
MAEGMQLSRVLRVAFGVPMELRWRQVMKMTGTARRRWFGGIALGLAAAMLILGETILNLRLTPRLFVLYWTSCFLLTMAAIIIAFLDIRAMQRKVGREQRDLLENALSDIEKQARRRKRG